jgi:hypothetical protein
MSKIKWSIHGLFRAKNQKIIKSGENSTSHHAGFFCIHSSCKLARGGTPLATLK